MPCWDPQRDIRIFLVVLLCSLFPACDSPEEIGYVEDLDYNYFTCEVQPVLARECSFPACHGSWQRPFRVLSPGKMRIAGEYEKARLAFSKEKAKAGEYAPLTPTELRFNFEQSMGFVSLEQPEVTSQLLTRPLAFLAGGNFHGIFGEHPLIGEVCQSTADPRCAILQRWLAGESSEEACQ